MPYFLEVPDTLPKCSPLHKVSQHQEEEALLKDAGASFTKGHRRAAEPSGDLKKGEGHG